MHASVDGWAWLWMSFMMVFWIVLIGACRLRSRASGAAAAGAEVVTGELVLVTTEDCHFCERAHGVLETLGVEAREISVDSAEARALAARGIPLAFLPVLTDGERVFAYGRFSEKRLRKEFAAVTSLLMAGSLAAAFAAGMVAFFAPCCAGVMMPAYLAAIGGGRRLRVARLTAVYVAGVSLVVLPITLGAAALASYVSRVAPADVHDRRADDDRRRGRALARDDAADRHAAAEADRLDALGLRARRLLRRRDRLLRAGPRRRDRALGDQRHDRRRPAPRHRLRRRDDGAADPARADLRPRQEARSRTRR